MSTAPRNLTVGPKGQVVIPKEIRDRMNIRPGDQVIVEAVDGEAHVRPITLGVGDLKGILPPSETGMADWEAEKRRERFREDDRDRVRAKKKKKKR